MAFNRLSTVACPFSPKCILSKGFFFWLFFSDFRSTDFGENAWKTLDPPYLVLRNWKKRSLKKRRRRGKKENAHDGLFGRIVQSVYFYVQNHYFSYNLIFGFETCPNTVDNRSKWSNFLKYFKYSEPKGAIFYFIFNTVYLKTTTLHVRTSLIFTFIS